MPLINKNLQTAAVILGVGYLFYKLSDAVPSHSPRSRSSIKTRAGDFPGPPIHYPLLPHGVVIGQFYRLTTRAMEAKGLWLTARPGSGERDAVFLPLNESWAGLQRWRFFEHKPGRVRVLTQDGAWHLTYYKEGIASVKPRIGLEKGKSDDQDYAVIPFASGMRIFAWGKELTAAFDPSLQLDMAAMVPFEQTPGSEVEWVAR